MSWTQTHRRWEALQEIEALATAGCTELPWKAEYAELFGDRDGLATFLRYRWELIESTQLDTHLTEAVLEDQRDRLAQRQAGIARMLDSRRAGSAPVRRESFRIVPTERVSA